MELFRVPQLAVLFVLAAERLATTLPLAINVLIDLAHGKDDARIVEKIPLTSVVPVFCRVMLGCYTRPHWAE